MSREVTLTVRHQCNSCKKEHVKTNHIALAAEITEPEMPEHWLEIKEYWKPLVHYCPDCKEGVLGVLLEGES